MTRPLWLAVLALPLAACLGPSTDFERDPPPVFADREPFNGTRAFEWVRAQVEAADGSPLYRIPGTQENTQVAGTIRDAADAYGWTAHLQHFNGTIRGVATPMHNVVAELPAVGNRLLLLGAHYDTRPWADKDPDPGRRDQPVLGANDGGSGVAVLLEIARILPSEPRNVTIRMIFFDGEDAGEGSQGWIQGSTHYAQSMSPADRARAEAFILLDIVGDVHLELAREQASSIPPHRELQDLIWTTARARNHTQFVDRVGPGVIDDHKPFQEIGIASVDVIHLDAGVDPFPDSHHTTFDDLAHVSEGSLFAVGDTILTVLRSWEAP